MVTWILVIVGALNWGVYAVTGWEVGSIFGGMTSNVSKGVYILVGVSALYELITHTKRCRTCSPDGGMNKPAAPIGM
jgi:uncharacterized membrane protein YuzA (DUF378 family)